MASQLSQIWEMITSLFGGGKEAKASIPSENINMDKLMSDLALDEKFSPTIYYDSRGNPTIGYGHLVLSDEMKKFNNQSYTMSDEEALATLRDDAQIAVDNFNKLHPSITSHLNEPRKRVIANMIYNLGFNKFLGFKKTIEALKSKDYETASDEMLDSLWANQVGDRARRLASEMRYGK